MVLNPSSARLRLLHKTSTVSPEIAVPDSRKSDAKNEFRKWPVVCVSQCARIYECLASLRSGVCASVLVHIFDSPVHRSVSQ